MEFGVNKKYVFRLPKATQIGLEHREKNIRTMTTNQLTPHLRFDRGQRFNGFLNFPLPSHWHKSQKQFVPFPKKWLWFQKCNIF